MGQLASKELFSLASILRDQAGRKESVSDSVSVSLHGADVFRETKLRSN